MTDQTAHSAFAEFLDRRLQPDPEPDGSTHAQPAPGSPQPNPNEGQPAPTPKASPANSFSDFLIAALSRTQ